MSGQDFIGGETPVANLAAALPLSVANLNDHWDELHHRGNRIARMAALSREPFSGQLAAFPLTIQQQSPTRLDAALNAISDLLAITEPGLAALNAIDARGQDTTAPALALWREFHASREAVMALAFDPSNES